MFNVIQNNHVEFFDKALKLRKDLDLTLPVIN